MFFLVTTQRLLGTLKQKQKEQLKTKLKVDNRKLKIRNKIKWWERKKKKNEKNEKKEISNF